MTSEDPHGLQVHGDTDEHSNPTNAHEILVLVIWDDKTKALKKEACFAVCFRTQGERRVDSPKGRAVQHTLCFFCNCMYFHSHKIESREQRLSQSAARRKEGASYKHYDCGGLNSGGKDNCCRHVTAVAATAAVTATAGTTAARTASAASTAAETSTAVTATIATTAAVATVTTAVATTAVVTATAGSSLAEVSGRKRQGGFVM